MYIYIYMQLNDSHQVKHHINMCVCRCVFVGVSV